MSGSGVNFLAYYCSNGFKLFKVINGN